MPQPTDLYEKRIYIIWCDGKYLTAALKNCYFNVKFYINHCLAFICIHQRTKAALVNWLKDV